jgi:hypothetical protein
LQVFVLTAVLEEDQTGLGKGAVTFRKRRLLNAMCHSALYRNGNLDRCGRHVRIALPWPPPLMLDLDFVAGGSGGAHPEL